MVLGPRTNGEVRLELVSCISFYHYCTLYLLFISIVSTCRRFYNVFQFQCLVKCVGYHILIKRTKKNKHKSQVLLNITWRSNSNYYTNYTNNTTTT